MWMTICSVTKPADQPFRGGFVGVLWGVPVRAEGVQLGGSLAGKLSSMV